MEMRTPSEITDKTMRSGVLLSFLMYVSWLKEVSLPRKVIKMCPTFPS